MNGLIQNIQKIVKENIPEITDSRTQREIVISKEAVARLFKKIEHSGIGYLGQNQIKYLG